MRVSRRSTLSAEMRGHSPSSISCSALLLLVLQFHIQFTRIIYTHCMSTSRLSCILSLPHAYGPQGESAHCDLGTPSQGNRPQSVALFPEEHAHAGRSCMSTE